MRSTILKYISQALRFQLMSGIVQSCSRGYGTIIYVKTDKRSNILSSVFTLQFVWQLPYFSFSLILLFDLNMPFQLLVLYAFERFFSALGCAASHLIAPSRTLALLALV